MLSKLGVHVRHNVVAYLALFVALGGTAVAARPLITGADIQDGSLTGADVENNSLTGSDVLESSLSNLNIDASGITGTITDAQVSDTLTASSAANADKLDGQDSTDFLSTSTAAGGDLTGSYPNPSVADGTITPAKLNAGLEFTDAGLPQMSGAICGPPGWYNSNVYPRAAYARDPFGVVHLRGVARDCTNLPPGAQGVIFTLPAGFRPEASHVMAAFGRSVLEPQSLFVTAGGIISTVFPNTRDISDISLSGVTFRCGPSGQNGCP